MKTIIGLEIHVQLSTATKGSSAGARRTTVTTSRTLTAARSVSGYPVRFPA